MTQAEEPGDDPIRRAKLHEAIRHLSSEVDDDRERWDSTDRLVVFPRPLGAIHYRDLLGPDAVAVIAWVGRGPNRDEALVVDKYGNCDWIDPSGLAVRDPLIVEAIAAANALENGVTTSVTVNPTDEATPSA